MLVILLFLCFTDQLMLKAILLSEEQTNQFLFSL